jgi:hypothetical protein
MRRDGEVRDHGATDVGRSDVATPNDQSVA